MARVTEVLSQVESYQRLRKKKKKKKKRVLDTFLLNTQHYKVGIKGKVKQSRKKKLRPSFTPQCSSYWKRSLRVTLDYSRLCMYVYI